MTKDLSRLAIDRAPAPRQQGGGRGVIVIVVLLLLIISYLAWERFGESAGSDLTVRLGRVMRVGGAPAQTGVAANGYVVARTRAALSTDIPGRLIEIPVEEGSRVQQGELIARLDTKQLDAEHAQAKAEVERARANRALARIEMERAQDLAKKRGQLITEAEVDAAKARHDETIALFDAASAAALRIAVMIEKSEVRAPFAGVIIEKNAEVGEIVSASSGGSNARGAVATLVDFSSLEVQVELAQTSLHAAREGASVLVYLDAFPEDAYPGRVRQIWPTANRQKASVELRIVFVERDDRILPDMGVRVVFQQDGGETAPQPTRVLLPKEALVAHPEPSVFLFQAGTVVKTAVETAGVDEQGRFLVKSGLRGSELVVLDPPAGLRDGDVVRRMKE
ncbi:MAG: efflux RND transporter periplasmic adaptor subunit [Planctomycetota bacterium]